MKFDNFGFYGISTFKRQVRMSTNSMTQNMYACLKGNRPFKAYCGQRGGASHSLPLSTNAVSVKTF
jgi:hypothetical protein